MKNKIRHVSRNKFNRCPVDPLIRFFGRYNFDTECTLLTIKAVDSSGKPVSMVHGGDTVKTVKINPAKEHAAIYSIISALYNISFDTLTDEEHFFGIPIQVGGLVATVSEDKYDTDFECTITLEFPDSPIQTKYKPEDVRAVKKVNK